MARAIWSKRSLVAGVIRSPLTNTWATNLRICRPVNLTEQDRRATIQYVLDREGHLYDTRNIFDLMRICFPHLQYHHNFVGVCSLLAVGIRRTSHISTLIAQAFQSVRYPILPRQVQVCRGDTPGHCDDVLLESKHFSDFTPRDFDLSPYFEIIKPTIRANFDYKKILSWLEGNVTE